MAKIKPIDVIKGISGKYNSKSGDYFSTNSSSNNIHLSKLSNPYKGPYTEKQIANRTAFKERSMAANAWLAVNRPTEERPLGTALYQEAQALKRKMALSSVTQVLYRYMNSENRIVLPSERMGELGNGHEQFQPGGMI